MNLRSYWCVQIGFMMKLHTSRSSSVGAALVILLSLPWSSHQLDYTQPSVPPHVTVSENAALGSVLTTITDTAPHSAGRMVNVLYQGSDHAFYADRVPGQHTWQVKLNRTLDYETQSMVQVAFRAFGGQNVDSTGVRFKLHVRDVNDNAPQFTHLPYNAMVDEDAAPGTAVNITIAASDVDTGAGGNVRFQMMEITQKSSSGGGSTFAIDANSGRVTLNGSLDYETKTFYHYKVLAQDLGSPALMATTDLFIEVEDVQDLPPVFLNVPYVASMPENVALGYHVLTIRAVDRDRAVPNTVMYNITHSTCPGLFQVEPDSGMLRVSGALDRDVSPLKELNGLCTVQLQATEKSGGQPQKGNFTAFATASLSVQDVKDNPPHFSPHSITATIPENSPPGTPLLVIPPSDHLQVTDLDQGSNSALQLSVVEGSEVFEVTTPYVQSAGSVQLRVTNSSRLDYETLRTLVVTIRASDGGAERFTDTATVTVSVLNRNEFSPQFTTKNGFYAASVYENSPPGTIVALVQATDRDAGQFGRITYGLRNARGLFSIDSASGEVRLASVLDREVQSVYSLLAVARDSGGLQHTVPLVVTVNDLNDNAPAFQRRQYGVFLSDNSTQLGLILSVQAVDADQQDTENSNVTYYIVSSTPATMESHFSLDPLLGRLSLIRPLDCDVLQPIGTAPGDARVTLVIGARDHGTPALSSDCAVVVVVDCSTHQSSSSTDEHKNQGTSGLHWAEVPADGSLQYACAGDSVDFLWSCTLGEGQVLEDVQWFYRGAHSAEMVAVLTNGAFLPLPAFASRVSHDNATGIFLSHVLPSDSGNYSVSVSGHNKDGTFFQERRTVVLQVGADLMTTDAKLHVREHPGAVLDRASGRWSVELQCGTFTYLGHPPFDVEWISPSLALLNDSRFEDGQFKLSLSQPIQGGNYTCRIPQHLTATACLANGTESQATYVLDELRTRLTLLEAYQAALLRDNTQLSSDNSALKARDHDLENRLKALEGASSHQVSFHADGLRNTHPKAGEVLIVENVVSNMGAGYSPSTGIFTAPANGTYFFVGTSGSWQSSQSGQFRLMVDGQVVSFVTTAGGGQGSGQTATVHSVVHMAMGHKAWLTVSASSADFSNAATSFSGFIVSPDP